MTEKDKKKVAVILSAFVILAVIGAIIMAPVNKNSIVGVWYSEGYSHIKGKEVYQDFELTLYDNGTSIFISHSDSDSVKRHYDSGTYRIDGHTIYVDCREGGSHVFTYRFGRMTCGEFEYSR